MLGPLIGLAGNLISGFLGSKGASAQNKAALAQAKAANAAQMKMAAKNIQLQKNFAQKGIQWKVADAAKAGVHPLYALGAQTMSFQPISIGTSSASPVNEMAPWADAAANMGQDLSRALSAGATSGERKAAVMATALDLEHKQLSNDLLRSQIARLNSAQVGPGVPGVEPMMIPGQGDSGVEPMPQRVVGASAARPFSEPGSVSDLGYARTATGWAPVPSSDIKQRIEDMWLMEIPWMLRNNVLPTMGGNMNPPFAAPAGKVWKFNPMKQEYQLWDAGSVGSWLVQ